MGITTALLFAAASLAGRHFVAPNWAVWLGGVLATVAFVAAFTLLLGPTRDDRRVIVSRVRALAAGLRRKS
jgi:hypothetical protein